VALKRALDLVSARAGSEPQLGVEGVEPEEIAVRTMTARWARAVPAGRPDRRFDVPRERVREGGSPNGGWDNDAFRGYADYALTAEFAEALDELQTLARERLTAVMCAEGLWWQCHRRLIVDRLVASGWTACHIGPNGALAEHALPPFAEPQGDGIVLYPPAQGSLLGPYASA
jgi:Domain of unknown function DUF488